MQSQTFDKEYSNLNTTQKIAVDEVYGPIMIVAGPGTGKTQIIGLRTANIILKTGTNPENILITTFTDSGVIAIKNRLLKFLGTDSYKVNVSTIHSFCEEVIKTFPEKFSYYKASELIDEVESLEIIKQTLEKLIEEKKIIELTNDYNKILYLRDIKNRISSLKGEGVSVLKLRKSIKDKKSIYEEELNEIKPSLKKYEQTKIKQEKHIKKLEELSLIFEHYDEYLREKGKYDFNDTINFVLEKFKSDDDLKYYYSEQFQFIMLDEYQDTNNAQNDIINEILSISQSPNIMVVGDDDQSIYRFQGANIENMLDFSSNFKDTKFIVLEKNYRSTPSILDLASCLIKNNTGRLSNNIKNIEKKLIANGNSNTHENKAKLFIAKSDVEEQSFVISKIKEICQEKKLEQIAIIVRSNKELEEWSIILQQNGIEVDSKLKTDILKSNYVDLIINYLKIIEDPYACEKSLINLLRTDLLGINQIDIFRINRELYIKNYNKKRKIRFADYLFDRKKLDLELMDEKTLSEFIKNLTEFSKILKEKSLIDFFGQFMTKTGILEYIEKNGNFDDIEDILSFSNKIKEWNRGNKSLNVENLIEKINLYKNYNYPISRQLVRKNKSGVQVLTAHSAKGLEFETVFIPGLYYGNWENKKITDKLKLPEGIAGKGIQDLNFDQIEEDRRLFFVALTRAKKDLFLSFPAGKDNKAVIASSFIEEINGKYKYLDTDISKQNIQNNIQNKLKNNLISYSNLEFDYIENFLENYKLSPSDLNSFLENPLEFLNKVVFKYPFEENEFTIFGKVYHRTLELFYLKYKKDLVLPEKSYLISTFCLLLEKEILTPAELEKLKKKGIEGLIGYYELYSTKHNKALLLEYKFRGKNIVFDGIPLTGTIDKIENIGEIPFNEKKDKKGQMAFFKNNVAVIDYKTGKIKTEAGIKGLDRSGNKKAGEGKYFRQLLFYKLLCELDNDFVSRFEIGSLAIDFVEGKDGVYKCIEVGYNEEEYEEFKGELKDAWEKIKNIEFWKEVLEKGK